MTKAHGKSWRQCIATSMEGESVDMNELQLLDRVETVCGVVLVKAKIKDVVMSMRNISTVTVKMQVAAKVHSSTMDQVKMAGIHHTYCGSEYSDERTVKT